MKAIEINGVIKKYNTIPKAWGNVISGFNLLSSSDWEAAGFYDLITPEHNSLVQEINGIEWDSENNNYRYIIIDKNFPQTVAELKERKIANLKSIYNRKLSETDWYIIRAQEGVAAPQEVLDARAALRSDCATKEGEINALTTKKAVVSYSLPNLD